MANEREEQLSTEEKQIAVLVDGDNVSPKYAEYIGKELEDVGHIKIYRLYGSINAPVVRKWYNVMPNYGIVPMLQLSYANRKSIVDQALTIDAMDILHSGEIDILCIVSSDSDFTKLTYRAKESGVQVIGMGEKKTLLPFVKACDEFKFLDLIYKEEIAKTAEPEEVEIEIPVEEPEIAEEPEITEETEPEEIRLPEISEVILTIKEYLAQDAGAFKRVKEVAKYLSKHYAGFDTRNYGYKSFKSMIHANAKDEFEFKTVYTGKHRNLFHSYLCIRLKGSSEEREQIDEEI